jgi:hypothetical protein
MHGVYAGSNGRYYTDWEVATRMESGDWTPCMWDPEAGWGLVEGDEGAMWLVPVERSALPPWAELRETPGGTGREVVDTRR